MTSSLFSEDTNDTLQVDAPDVYIDCEWCDMDFIKTEIPFVDHVIDRKVADIYILITTQETAGEGTEYTLMFYGQDNFVGMNDTLTFMSVKFDTDDTIRRALVQKLKLGLMRYIAKTPVADDISISMVKKVSPMLVTDKWRNWLFSISVDGYVNGEQSRTYRSIHSSFSARKVTEYLKIYASVYYRHYGSVFQMDDTTEISSFSKSYGPSASIILGLNDHWSTAIGTSMYSSTYSNEKINYRVGPGLEYSIFPYSQSTSRELRLIYKIGYQYNFYYEETIYDKIEEKLCYEYGSATLDIKQRWGTVTTTLSGSHYFHDFGKNELTLYSDLSLPIIKGFSLDLSGYVALIHDQLSLPKRDLTPEEILLQIKQLDSQYYYNFSIGLEYSFGSLYSNIVNPRFGS